MTVSDTTTSGPGAGLTALVLGCTLNRSPEPSSSELIGTQILDEMRRLGATGKVAALGVVGNEDGTHHVIAECLQALNDTGFSVAANSGSYWVGEAMQGVDYQDHDATPDSTAGTNKSVAANAVHVARLLKQNPYPPS